MHSTRFVLLIGAVAVCLCVGGMIVSYHTYSDGIEDLFTLSMMISVWSTIWFVDAVRCTLAEKTWRKKDRATAMKHLRHVLILRSKEKQIQLLVQGDSDD